MLFSCAYIATYNVFGEQTKFTMSIEGEIGKSVLIRNSLNNRVLNRNEA